MIQDKKGNIIAYEKKARMQDDNKLSQDRVDKFRNELEAHRITLKDTYKMVQPTQESIDQLCYRTEAARKVISGIDYRYSHYKKD